MLEKTSVSKSKENPEPFAPTVWQALERTFTPRGQEFRSRHHLFNIETTTKPLRAVEPGTRLSLILAHEFPLESQVIKAGSGLELYFDGDHLEGLVFRLHSKLVSLSPREGQVEVHQTINTGKNKWQLLPEAVNLDSQTQIEIVRLVKLLELEIKVVPKWQQKLELLRPILAEGACSLALCALMKAAGLFDNNAFVFPEKFQAIANPVPIVQSYKLPSEREVQAREREIRLQKQKIATKLTALFQAGELESSVLRANLNRNNHNTPESYSITQDNAEVFRATQNALTIAGLQPNESQINNVLDKMRIDSSLRPSFQLLLHGGIKDNQSAQKLLKAFMRYDGREVIDLKDAELLAKSRFATLGELGHYLAENNWELPGSKVQLIGEVELLKNGDTVFGYDPYSRENSSFGYTVVGRGLDQNKQPVVFLYGFDAKSRKVRLFTVNNQNLSTFFKPSQSETEFTNIISLRAVSSLLRP